MADTKTAAAKTEVKTEVKTDAKAGAKAKPSGEAKTEVRAEAKDVAASDAGPGKETESSTADAPKGYSRSENQKVVTDAYRHNWGDIFGKKPRRKSKK